MKIENRETLAIAILELEKKRQVQEGELTAQFKKTSESLSPINLIRNGITNLTAMPGIGESILKAAAGIGLGVLSKKLFLGRSPNLIKKLLGSFFELVVAKTSVDNADKIKAYGTSLYHNLFKKKRVDQTSQE